MRKERSVVTVGGFYGGIDTADIDKKQKLVDDHLATLSGMTEIGQAVSKAKDDFLKAHGKAMQDVAAMMTPGVREHCAVHHDLKAIFDEYQALWVGNGSAEDLIRAERNIANFSFATKSDLSADN